MANWLGGWEHRIAITIDHTTVDAALTHFPVRVPLSVSCGKDSQDLTAVFDELGTEYLKIAITSDDGKTQLYVEVEKWDFATEKAELWVSKIGWSISDTVDTIIYLYYDVNHGDNTTYVGVPNDAIVHNVWDANFVLVDHMQDDPDNAHTRDSTIYGHDGTKKGADEPIEEVGLIGEQQDFDGINDYISHGDQAEYSFGANTDFELEFIFKGTVIPVSFTDILSKKHNHGTALPGYAAYLASITGCVRFQLSDGINRKDIDSLTAITDGAFHHIACAADRDGNAEIFKNGASDSAQVAIGAVGDIDAAKVLFIGGSTTIARYNDCDLDEIRISNTLRSAAWRKATYNTCFDTFLSFGDVEGVTGVLINDAEIQIRKESLSIDLRIEERSIAEFTVVDRLGTATYQKGQSVWIYGNDGVLLFGGVIETPEKVAMSPKGGLWHPIRCIDWHYLADKRLVALSYLATAAGTIVEGIRSTYLADEGVTVGNIEAGPDIVEAVFNYARASDCFDKLAELANKIWFIDEDKKLYFQARDITAAPWAAFAATNIDNCRWSGGNPKYRNRQYIRGGKATTGLEQTENFIGDAKQNAFTVSFPIASTPSGATGSVKINAGADLTMGIKGLDAPGDFECYWAKGDPTIYFTAVPALNDAIEVKYYGLYDILVLVEDDAAIAAQLAVEGSGTGFVDQIDDEPKLTDQDASIDAGQAKLAKFAVAGQRLLYSTVETGLKPGQLQPVTYTAFGLAATDMLIEAVHIWTEGENHVIYDITAIQGPVTGSWTDYFKALAHMKHEIIERLNVGSEQILIILAEFEGHVEVRDELATIATACPFPAADLYPEPTLYPC